ncbi:polysaccharide biosynthesis tyrosine autokinase [Microbacterium sp. NPDC055357]
MTLRQVLDVLWKRIWVILAITAVAGIVAVGYLQVRDVTYETSGTVRLNAVVTETAVSGEIGGMTVDLDPETITAPVILDAAAAITGDARGALAGQIEARLDDSSRTGRLTVTASGPSPESAQARANAVIEAYVAYVDEQMTEVQTTLREQHTEAIQQATELQREVFRNPENAIAQSNLASALNRMSMLQTQLDAIAASGPTMTVLREPAPGESTVPGQLIVFGLALLTGAIVGIGVVLIRDQFDNRLRGSDEVEGIAGTVSLGELRWDRSVKRLDPPLPVASSQRTDLSEGLRTVRSTVQVLIPPRHAVVVVTSVEPGDGKSFISSNLALAWARAGKSVILVGGDLRRPDLARYFGDAADGEGVAELLQNQEDGTPVSSEEIEARLNVTTYRRLRILPAGAEPRDPADLLAGAAYESLVDELRLLADIVIIDSPPAIGLADASLLSMYTDGAIVVASVMRTDRTLLADTVAGLRANGVEILGVVANRGRRKLPKTYAAYYMRSDKSGRRRTAQVTPDSQPLDTDVEDDDLDVFDGRSDLADRPRYRRGVTTNPVPTTRPKTSVLHPQPPDEQESGAPA